MITMANYQFVSRMMRDEHFAMNFYLLTYSLSKDQDTRDKRRVETGETVSNRYGRQHRSTDQIHPQTSVDTC